MSSIKVNCTTICNYCLHENRKTGVLECQDAPLHAHFVDCLDSGQPNRFCSASVPVGRSSASEHGNTIPDFRNVEYKTTRRNQPGQWLLPSSSTPSSTFHSTKLPGSSPIVPAIATRSLSTTPTSHRYPPIPTRLVFGFAGLVVSLEPDQYCHGALPPRYIDRSSSPRSTAFLSGFSGVMVHASGYIVYISLQFAIKIWIHQRRLSIAA